MAKREIHQEHYRPGGPNRDELRTMCWQNSLLKSLLRKLDMDLPGGSKNDGAAGH